MTSTPAVLHPLIRPATRDDLPRVVELIRGGALDGGAGDDASTELSAVYYESFEEIEADPNNAIMVAEHDGRVVGTFQFTVIPQIQRRAGRVAQVESVHVAAEMRGRRIGEAMMRWAIDEARRRGCDRIQLTSNVARKDAHRFYQRLGFEASHVGMKLGL